MTNFTLRQLRYFDALAEHGHFGRAASACAISQPALSVQIKELEAAFGVPLFERGARQVRPTAAGEDLLARARAVLDAADDLSDAARVAGSRALGRLRIGIIPTIAPYLLPRFIADLTVRHPGLDLQVRETLTPRLIEELANGRIDAAIVALPVSEPAFAEVALFTEDFVLVRHHRDRGKPVPDGEDLRKMRLLLLEEGHCFRDQALSFCELPTATPREGLDGSSLTTLVQMVGAGLGVTLIPQMAVAVEAQAAAVDVARFQSPAPTRTIGMIWRKSSMLLPQLAEVSEIVRGVASAPDRYTAEPPLQ